MNRACRFVPLSRQYPRNRIGPHPDNFFPQGILAGRFCGNQRGNNYAQTRGSDPIEEICETFGVSYGELLAYAAHNHWVKPRPAGRHLEDLGDMASALAWALLDRRDEAVANRTRRFVGAMVKLEVGVSEIAEVLHVSEKSLRDEFPKELADVRD